MSDEGIRTIEVSGIKFDVDMRTAKKIETYRVGDRVKVLVKNYNGYESHAGAIIAIDAFKNLPTVVVAYIPGVFGSTGEVKLAYLNAESSDVEICPMCDDDIVPTRDTIIKYFDVAIEKHERDIAEIRIKKEYFLRKYGAAFAVCAQDVAAATQ